MPGTGGTAADHVPTPVPDIGLSVREPAFPIAHRNGGPLRVGVDSHQFIAAVGAPDIVEAGHGELDVLGLGGFVEGKGAPAFGVDYIDGCARFAGLAEFGEGIDQDAGGRGIDAGEVTGGLIDEGDEGGVQGEIVADVIEGGSEDDDVAFADLPIEQQGGLIGEAGGDAGPGGGALGGLGELDVV